MSNYNYNYNYNPNQNPNMNPNNQGRELGWEDTIVQDAPEFIVLPDGDYKFTVTKFERGRFNGSEKMPACNMAKLTLDIENPMGKCTVTHNLLMHSRFEARISEFFASLGMKKKGQPLQINWNIIGLGGMCKIGTRTYNGNNYNEVKKFISREDIAPVPADMPWDR